MERNLHIAFVAVPLFAQHHCDLEMNYSLFKHFADLTSKLFIVPQPVDCDLATELRILNSSFCQSKQTRRRSTNKVDTK